MAPAEKRSIGVTSAAIVLIAGSALLLLLAFLLLILPSLGRPGVTRGGAGPFGLAALVLLYLLLSAWGSVTGVGILLLRPWARISMLVMSILTASALLFTSLMMLIVTPAMALPQDPRAMRIMYFALLVIFGLPFAIALWWIILFTRKSVRHQFDAAAVALAETPRKGGRPASITVIAVWLLVSVPLSVLSVLRFGWGAFPFVVFGAVISGWTGTVLYLAFQAADVILGLGLLGLRRWARAGTLAICVFWIVNAVATALRPRVYDEVLNFVASRTSSPFPAVLPHSFMWATGALSALLALVAMWFLIAHKPAFAPPAVLDTPRS